MTISKIRQVESPGKINLFLEVLRRREDGYHELVTVMSRISLADHMNFTVLDNRLELNQTSASANDANALPAAEQNLIYRTLDRLRDRTGCSLGMRVDLIKRIPIQAGLGGASSNAATALCVANELWELGLTPRELADIANSLGSDIAFFLSPGPSVCRGRGEIVEPISIATSMPLLLVMPPFGLSTAAMFAALRLPEEPRSVEHLLAELQTVRAPFGNLSLFNRFEETARRQSPWFATIHRRLLDAGAVAAQMTGSGSCYFGIFPSESDAHAAAARLATDFPDCRFMVCRTID